MSDFSFFVAFKNGDTFCCKDYEYSGEEIVLSHVFQVTPDGWRARSEEMRNHVNNIRAIYPGNYDLGWSFHKFPSLTPLQNKTQ